MIENEPVAAAEQLAPVGVPTADTTTDSAGDPPAVRGRGRVTSPLGPGSPATLLMAVISGLCVANMYYLQPIVPKMAQMLHVSVGSLLVAVSATQIGYAVGLLLLVPLGDILPRRRLVRVLMAATAVILLLLPFARGPLLVVAFALLGLTTCSGQVIIPWAADLAREGAAGRVVGTVMTGLILGTLLCRAFAGFIVDLGGWQAVYWTACAVTVACLLATGLLPQSPAKSARLSYPALLRSIPRVAIGRPKVVERALIGALAFASFSIFWTTLPLHLSGPPLNYGPGLIGLFGFLGAAGAVGANVAGRLGDRGLRWFSSLGGFALIALAFAGQIGFVHAVAVAIAGAVVLDFGVQLANVSNQTAAISLAPELRSRLNTVYMVIYFLGGAAGSALAGWLWPRVGWTGTSVAGIVAAALAVALLAITGRSSRPGPAVAR